MRERRRARPPAHPRRRAQQQQPRGERKTAASVRPQTQQEQQPQGEDAAAPSHRRAQRAYAKAHANALRRHEAPQPACSPQRLRARRQRRLLRRAARQEPPRRWQWEPAPHAARRASARPMLHQTRQRRAAPRASCSRVTERAGAARMVSPSERPLRRLQAARRQQPRLQAMQQQEQRHHREWQQAPMDEAMQYPQMARAQTGWLVKLRRMCEPSAAGRACPWRRAAGATSPARTRQTRGRRSAAASHAMASAR